MALYIKANPLVAKALGLENVRNKVKDGNYMLWQADMLAFGSTALLNLGALMDKIGAIALTPRDAKSEFDGRIIRPLPIATDPAYILPEPPVQEEPNEESNEDAQQEEEVVDEETDTDEEIPSEIPDPTESDDEEDEEEDVESDK